MRHRPAILSLCLALGTVCATAALSIEDWDRRAADSKDPVLVWIAAIEQAGVAEAPLKAHAVRKLRRLDDPRALPALRKLIREPRGADAGAPSLLTSRAGCRTLLSVRMGRRTLAMKIKEVVHEAAEGRPVAASGQGGGNRGGRSGMTARG